MATRPFHSSWQGATAVKTSTPEGSARPRAFQKPRLAALRAHVALVHSSLSQCRRGAWEFRCSVTTQTPLAWRPGEPPSVIPSPGLLSFRDPSAATTKDRKSP